MRREVEEDQLKAQELHKKTKKEKLRLTFEKESIEDSQAITILFRLPTTTKIERKFDRSHPIQRMYDYVSSLENNGLTNEEMPFEITKTFPRVVLNPQNKIEDVFGKSDGEMVNVFEL